MIKLPKVTLLALTGWDYKKSEHELALRKSATGIKFAKVRLIELKWIKDINSWNKAVVYDLWKYFETDYCLLIHDDGYVINPELWQNKWLQYDYAGAPWPLPKDNYSYRDPYGQIQRVGNSVGLRSRKLLKLPTELKLEWKSFYGNTNEDGFFAVHNRKILEENGCKFMPFNEALVFGKESELPENKDLSTFLRHQI